MKSTLLTGAVFLAMTSLSSAATISFSDSVANTTTNYISSVSLTKFDTALGTLTSIKFTLDGTVLSNIKVESQDAAPAVITGTSSATLTLKRPDLSTLVVTLPVNSATFNATAFDGVVDFGGTSGNDFGTVSAMNNNAFTTSSAFDKALFSQAGFGSIVLPVSAVGLSAASGAGNLISQIATQAGAIATVEYTYSTVVPEPSTYVLLGSALASLAFFRRKLSK